MDCSSTGNVALVFGLSIYHVMIHLPHHVLNALAIDHMSFVFTPISLQIQRQLLSDQS